MTDATPRLLTEAEATDLIDRLQRSSSRWRPLIISGLLAIISGFVVLAWTLNARLAATNELAATQARSIVQLNATIANSQLIVSRNLAGDANSDWHAMARLLKLADSQNDTLGTTINVQPGAINAAAVDAASGTSAPPTNPGKTDVATDPTAKDIGPRIIRLYVQIASEDQRASAAAVAALWSGRQVGDAAIVVPGIELVRNGGDNTVRCTRRDACASLDAVARFVNSTLSEPVLTGKDISKRYGSALNILPGTYEVWFAPGAIKAAPAKGEDR